MRPPELRAKILLDSGDPGETREAIKVLGFLDGQITSPSLVVNTSFVKKQQGNGRRLSGEELMKIYRSHVKEVSSILPKAFVCIGVRADPWATAHDLLRQGKEVYSWIRNGFIGFPVTLEGMRAAARAVLDHARICMTFCFNQEQAAAAYAATRKARKGSVLLLVSLGLLDDEGLNGMDLIKNIVEMYQGGDGHVEVVAGVGNQDHLLGALKLGVNMVAGPFSVLKEWGEKGLPLPLPDYIYPCRELKGLPYKAIDLTWDWQRYRIHDEMTLACMRRLSAE